MQSNEALMLAFGKKTQILHEGLAPTVRTPQNRTPHAALFVSTDHSGGTRSAYHKSPADRRDRRAKV